MHLSFKPRVLLGYKKFGGSTESHDSLIYRRFNAAYLCSMLVSERFLRKNRESGPWENRSRIVIAVCLQFQSPPKAIEIGTKVSHAGFSLVQYPIRSGNPVGPTVELSVQIYCIQ